MNRLHPFDYFVFIIYFLIVGFYGIYIYHRKKSVEMDSKDFFLAEGSLTWWAIGASLIASNISAEQLIGMSGSGFALGLAISSYEWMAAAALIVVAVFFIPVYLKNKIFTMPQFLSVRYNDTVSTIMAIFWLLVYILINLTSIIYLGSLAVTAITGIPFGWCVVGLALFATVVTLGGMKVIGYTDVFQVLVLIVGGLVTVYLGLKMVAAHFGYGSNILKGFMILTDKVPSHFHMIFKRTNPYYKDLPGLSILIGGMWINNLNYWGCNQYITQRALGADLKTARKGILFAAFLKLLTPVIAVLPGIIVYALYQQGMFRSQMAGAGGTVAPDHAYPTLLNLLPEGLKGLAFAALTAAVVASLAGKANSVSTIFSLDIYRKYFRKQATEKQLVRVGRWAVVLSMVVACLIVPSLGVLNQAYQFIQEYEGFISPGVLAIFLLGLFWKRTTARAALAAVILTIPLSALLKFLPAWSGGWFPDFAFLNRMTIVFVILVALMVWMTLRDSKSREARAVIHIDRSQYRCTPSFIVGSVVVVVLLTVLYAVFW
jgi:SSS family solute:Na+ symporter